LTGLPNCLVSIREQILDILLKADKKLFLYFSRKMLNYLCWNGIEEAKNLLQEVGTRKDDEGDDIFEMDNRPSKKQALGDFFNFSSRVFKIALKHINETQFLSNLKKWAHEDRTRFLVKAIDTPNSSLQNIVDAIIRYHDIPEEGVGVSMKRKSISWVVLRMPQQVLPVKLISWYIAMARTNYEMSYSSGLGGVELVPGGDESPSNRAYL
jgi:hypothetical protein